jgi:hypothetical protein
VIYTCRGVISSSPGVSPILRPDGSFICAAKRWLSGWQELARLDLIKVFGCWKRRIYFWGRIQDLPEEDQAKIKQCLEMVKFGMASTLLTFVDKYYEYDGDQDPEDKGLKIGSYESAWLADLAGAYTLENTQLFFKHTIKISWNIWR